MKRGNLKTIALLGGALVIPAYADKVQLQQLPQGVQDKIRSQTGSARIEDIDRDMRNGRPVYEVGFKQNGQEQELQFDENGNLLNGNANASTGTLDSRKLTRSELPQAVRRTVRTRLQGMEINDIERTVKNGQVTYGIGYKQSGGVGPQQELVLSDTGSILRSSAGLSDSPAVASSSSPSGIWGPSSPSSTVGTGGTVVSSASTTGNSGTIPGRTINYTELPQNVRSVAEANLNHGGVKRVQRLVQNGEIDYQIDFLKDNGQSQQMTISEDGRILGNQTLSGPGLAGTSSQPVTTLMNYNELPQKVRSVAEANLNHGGVKRVERVAENGSVNYRIDFLKDNGKYQEMLIAEDGRILGNQTLDSASGSSGTFQSGNSSPATNNTGLLNRLGQAIFNNGSNQQ